ncbi:Transposase, Mutator family [Streptococcus sanguinis]|nr:Transposase, Mutator family [Streptococcus sanguinis]
MKQLSKIIILLLGGLLIMVGLSACGEKIPENRTKEQYELEKEFQPLFDFLAEEKKGLSNVKIYYSSIYITDRKTKVKRVDRAIILEQFKTIYRAENLEMAVQALEDFVAEWKPKYRKVMESLENTDNLLTFYQSPYQIWHGIIRQILLNLSTKK